jgi:hypothetical protein
VDTLVVVVVVVLLKEVFTVDVSVNGPSCALMGGTLYNDMNVEITIMAIKKTTK